MLLMNLALGEEPYQEDKVVSGFRFSTQQSISGTGFMSSYRCLNNGSLILKSHSSGSGSYSSDSNLLDEYFTLSNIVYQDYTSSTNRVKFNDNVSAAYFPTTIDLGGSARIGPIKSTWSDSTLAGNSYGTAIRADFDHANALVKNMATEISESSLDSLETTTTYTSGSFEASMELNSAFNGTAQLSATELERNRPEDRGTPKTDMDEYYRGSFSLTKKMKIAEKSTYSEDDDDWASCCIEGYKTMPTYYKRGSVRLWLRCQWGLRLHLLQDANDSRIPEGLLGICIEG